MSALGLTLSLVLAVAIGYGPASVVWPAAPAGGWPRLARLGLAVGLGLGITSVLYFLWLVVVGPFAPGMWGVEVVLVAGSAGLVWRGRKAAKDRDNDNDNDKDKGKDEDGGVGVGGTVGREERVGRGVELARWVLAGVVSLLALHWVASFTAVSRLSPHGRWDAWTIWNLRARFLFRSAGEWETAFSPFLAWTHLDYPLLVPGAVARLWTEVGSDPAMGSILIAGAFGLATAVMLMGTLGSLRGTGQGLVAGVFLLGTEAFVGQSAAQNADVPLGLYYLTVFCLVALGFRYPGRRRGILILAGVAAGLAAWTKNEGFVFIAVLALSWLVAALWSQDRRKRLDELAALGVGMLPVLLVVVAFKMTLALPNDILASMDVAGTLDRLTDPDRILYVLARFGGGFIGYGRWAVSAPAVLALYGLLAGVGGSREVPGRAPDARGRIAATVALMYLAYLLVYVVTPHDVIWHLDTSLRRLLQQLWPSALFAFFLFVRTPEELLSRLRPVKPVEA